MTRLSLERREELELITTLITQKVLRGRQGGRVVSLTNQGAQMTNQKA